MSFLPLGEAAAHLGVSRLKLRRAVALGHVEARRDNEGRWRVDLTAARGALETGAEDGADPALLMEALFDEIEELSGELEEAQGAGAQLAGLAGAQADALERAATALEKVAAERDRLGGIAGRALAAADEAEARAAALQSTADRALGLLDRATSALGAMQREVEALKSDATRKDATIESHAAQLDRLFTLSEQALEKAAEARREPTLIARVFGAGRGRN